jgi:hypothetical protein
MVSGRTRTDSRTPDRGRGTDRRTTRTAPHQRAPPYPPHTTGDRRHPRRHTAPLHTRGDNRPGHRHDNRQRAHHDRHTQKPRPCLTCHANQHRRRGYPDRTSPPRTRRITAHAGASTARCIYASTRSARNAKHRPRWSTTYTQPEHGPTCSGERTTTSRSAQHATTGRERQRTERRAGPPTKDRASTPVQPKTTGSRVHAPSTAGDSPL